MLMTLGVTSTGTQCRLELVAIKRSNSRTFVTAICFFYKGEIGPIFANEKTCFYAVDLRYFMENRNAVL